VKASVPSVCLASAARIAVASEHKSPQGRLAGVVFTGGTMQPMANIASTIIRADGMQVVVMAHNRAQLTDEEWESGYLAKIREVKDGAGKDTASNLVFAEGQGPNAKQRAAGNAIFGTKEGYLFRVAVVTDSMLVRGVVTTLSWFNPMIDAYGPHDWERAVSHVRLMEKHYRQLGEALRKLKAEVSDVGVLRDVEALLSRRVGQSLGHRQ
jgi:hypothetical protein